MISGNITASPVQTIFLCIDIHRDTYVMYLVRTKPKKELSDLRNEMDSKNIEIQAHSEKRYTVLGECKNR